MAFHLLFNPLKVGNITLEGVFNIKPIKHLYNYFQSIINQLFVSGISRDNSVNYLISQYHQSVIKILPERNFHKLLKHCIDRSILLSRASGGLFCTIASYNFLTIEICSHDDFKRHEILPIPPDIQKATLVAECTLLPMQSVKQFSSLTLFKIRSENIIISPFFMKKKLIGLFLFFDNISTHIFTRNDHFLLSLFIQTVSFVANNLLEYRSSKKRAQTDSLTGLLNRRVFLNRTDYEISRSLRYNHPLAICMFDIDHFKDINDNWGHPAGDQVLVSLANICRNLLRTVDFIARYGGDEFIILLTETPPEVAMEAAERLRFAASTMPVKYQALSITVSLSIGIASLSEDCKSSEKLIERADAAMYYAKRTGKNKIALWNDVIKKDLSERLI